MGSVVAAAVADEPLFDEHAANAAPEATATEAMAMARLRERAVRERAVR
ncbi:MAG: hypothetical protein M0Z63_01175 [Actinomycetota bacterium]|nr:hypothetical protein [Actinomycetota bacterium]